MPGCSGAGKSWPLDLDWRWLWFARRRPIERDGRCLQRSLRSRRDQPPNGLRPKHDISKTGVKLLSSEAANFLQNALEGKRLSIWAISCHRIERVSNHDNPCADWDIVARKTIGIPSPVEVFVMMPNGPLYRALQR